MEYDDLFNRLQAQPVLAEPGELSQFAAAAALKELIINWRAAVGDGFNIIDLLKDIDRTALELQKFKIAMENEILRCSQNKGKVKL